MTSPRPPVSNATARLDGEKWVPTFPKAAYHVVQTEYVYWKSVADLTETVGPVVDGATISADSVQPIVEAGLDTFIEPNASITPEASVIPSDGHVASPRPSPGRCLCISPTPRRLL